MEARVSELEMDWIFLENILCFREDTLCFSGGSGGYFVFFSDAGDGVLCVCFGGVFCVFR